MGHDKLERNRQVLQEFGKPVYSNRIGFIEHSKAPVLWTPLQDERSSRIDPNLLVLPPYEIHVVQTRKIPGSES